MNIFGTSQISVSMALMPYSFDLGYIIIISFREKEQRLKLAGYCPWTIWFIFSCISMNRTLPYDTEQHFAIIHTFNLLSLHLHIQRYATHSYNTRDVTALKCLNLREMTLFFVFIFTVIILVTMFTGCTFT